MHSVNNKSLYVQGSLNPLDHKDLLQCIARHLLPSNAFTDALPIQLKAVIATAHKVEVKALFRQ